MESGGRSGDILSFDGVLKKDACDDGKFKWRYKKVRDKKVSYRVI